MRLSIYFSLALSWITCLMNAQNDKKLDSLLDVYQNQKKDTFKIKTINELINYYMYRDSDIAKDYILQQLDLANELHDEYGKSLANYQLGIWHNNRDHLDSARTFYTKSKKLAQKIHNQIQISKALHGLAILEFTQGNLVKTDSLNDENLALSLKNKDSVGIALSYDFKGTINQNRGYYKIALENVLKGLQLFEKLNQPIRIADSKNHLANIQNSLNNLDNALLYYTEALKVYEEQEDIYYQSQVLNDIGIIYKKKKNYDLAINYFTNSIKKSKLVNVKSIEVSSTTNIGSTFSEKGNYNQSILYLNQAIDIANQYNFKRKKAIAQNQLAKVYNKINKPTLAIELLEETISYCTSSKNQSILDDLYHNRSQSYELLNDYKKAITDYKAYKNIQDSILNQKKSKQIEELRIIYETEKKETALALQEKEIENLNKEVEISNLRKGLYAGGMVSFIAVSGLLFFGFKQRIKKSKIEREKQEEIYRQEIEFKKKELTSQTLHLVQKNSFLQELKENLENLKNSPDKFKTEFRRIVMLLKKESASDKDWEIFKSYFTEVHDNFDNKLRNVYPEISEKEIRLASFLKMNLSTKEIANILNVLPDSVLKSKYRLKKKLNLDKKTDLYEYLIRI